MLFELWSAHKGYRYTGPTLFFVFLFTHFPCLSFWITAQSRPQWLAYIFFFFFNSKINRKRDTQLGWIGRRSSAVNRGMRAVSEHNTQKWCLCRCVKKEAHNYTLEGHLEIGGVYVLPSGAGSHKTQERKKNIHTRAWLELWKKDAQNFVLKKKWFLDHLSTFFSRAARQCFMVEVKRII